MHKSRLGALIIDCEAEDLAPHARFWGEALGLATASSEQQVNARYLRFDNKPEEVQLLLQKVDHPSRIHIDIETDDIKAEVQRLQSLGATVIAEREKWTVMEAPSGHRFCVINPLRSGFDADANTWPA